MALTGKARIIKHADANTMYVAIPAKIVQDSAFTFHAGERVKICFDPKQKAIIISHRDLVK
ncbi:MAG: hypothetical protein JRN68_06680 [Nitrososphaerota archaeon]|nr:hypothetical protein [Nitrososphaerota archaeon]